MPVTATARQMRTYVGGGRLMETWSAGVDAISSPEFLSVDEISPVTGASLGSTAIGLLVGPLDGALDGETSLGSIR